MSDSKPSLQEWRDLYQLAMEFKKIECWTWMSDTDLFGVQNPANGITGYCCIMGALGEAFGLNVYLGSEGLAGYWKTQTEHDSTDAIDFLHFQKCLTLTFEDRKYLREPDLEVIKALGLKFRGRQEWPLFRNYEPGCFPWYLTHDEGVYLKVLLPQVIEVALRRREKKDLLVPPQKNRYLVRIPERTGQSITWKEDWLEPAPIEKVKWEIPSVDELHLQRIKRIISRHEGIWEIDQFYSPGPIDEGGRPYFPHVFLWVDHDSDLVLNVRVAERSHYQSDFQDQLIGLLEKAKFPPNEIWFQNEEPLRLSEPIAPRLGIQMKLVNRLPALEKARSHLYSFFEQDKTRSKN